MPTCNNCGAHVTPRFVKVFGHNGDLAACLSCRDKQDMANGAGMPQTNDEQA